MRSRGEMHSIMGNPNRNDVASESKKCTLPECRLPDITAIRNEKSVKSK